MQEKRKDKRMDLTCEIVLNRLDTKDNTNAVFVNFKFDLDSHTITDELEDLSLYLKHASTNESGIITISDKQGIVIKNYFTTGENTGKIETIQTSDSRRLTTVDLDRIKESIQSWLNDYHGSLTSVEDIFKSNDNDSKTTLLAAFQGSNGIQWS